MKPSSPLPRSLRQRETLADPDDFRTRHQVTSKLIQRLALSTELSGHRGCVNCLQWSEDGRTLASGSDDCKVILWSPLRSGGQEEARASGPKVILDTEHRGNIFSVKFMPFENNNLIATGAADNLVQLLDVTKGKTLRIFDEHPHRVKRLEVVHDCPNLIWSAAEDGTIMEMDIRAPLSSTVNVLVNLKSCAGNRAEARCLAINQHRHELLAVGANDPYIRVFDRRKINAQLIEFPPVGRSAGERYIRLSHLAKLDRCVSSSLMACSQYYSAGHLARRTRNRGRFHGSIYSTFVTFSPDGKDLLANMGGEHIYLFDMANPSHKLIDTCQFRQFTVDRSSEVDHTPPVDLVGAVASLNKRAKEQFAKKEYTAAIYLYNHAIAALATGGSNRKGQRDGDLESSSSCFHPVLHGNRALAYLKRRWDGDLYACLRDSFRVLQCDLGHIKSYLRICECLIEYNWFRETEQWLELFRRRFPDHVCSAAFIRIEGELKEAMASEEARQKARTSRKKDNQDEDKNAPNQSPSLLSLFEFVGMEELEEEGDILQRLGAEVDEAGNRRYAPVLQASEVWSEKEEEMACRMNAKDYTQFFNGHCNTTTDIKEASFFGREGRYIVAGSDDANLFFWDRLTTNVIKVRKGDQLTVNCAQSHPFDCLLATSGIDSTVKLWEPAPEFDEASSPKSNEETCFEEVLLQMNQERMSEWTIDNSSSDDNDASAPSFQCRPS